MYLITTEQLLYEQVERLKRDIPEQSVAVDEADENAKLTRRNYHLMQEALTKAMRALEAIDERNA